MGADSKIEWTDHTFNPWLGCQKVSPGCDHCYAEALMDKRYGKVEWGPHGERKRTSEANWKLPMRWARQANGKRPRVFCASLADWLDNQVPQQWRVDLARLIVATPQLDWLLLTKRIENFHKLSPFGSNIPFPPNVWLGITCEDQEHYDKRWSILSKIPSTVRFISYEPALGPLRIQSMALVLDRPVKMFPDWIICGGESGKDARPMNPQWALDLKNDCSLVGVPFFFKQWGEWSAPGWKQEGFKDYWWPLENGRGPISYKVGKHRAGRLLEGREYSQFPTPTKERED